ncbi:MAG: hypothetical protein U1F81_17055 [Verrucomicrobiaceae bacterium]
MNFAAVNTYSELAQLFDELNARVQTLRDRLGYEESDARQVLLRGIQIVIAGYAMGFRAMWFGRTGNQIDEALGVANLSFDEKRQAVEDAWRLGLVTLCMFKIDALLGRLLTALALPVHLGFFRNARSLLNTITIGAPNLKLDTLMVPAAIRNSLHNNGIHRGPNSSMLLHGMQYDFSDGDSVQCAGWQHIFAALTACIDVLDEILFSAEIQAIPSGIEEPYVVKLRELEELGD